MPSVFSRKTPDEVAGKPRLASYELDGPLERVLVADVLAMINRLLSKGFSQHSSVRVFWL